MLISNLEKMESVINTNPNLSWDGWNVVHTKQSNDAIYKTNGAFINGSWYIKTVYSPGRDGWNIKNNHLDR